MCFEINGLKNLKLTILRLLGPEPPFIYTTIISMILFTLLLPGCFLYTFSVFVRF